MNISPVILRKINSIPLTSISYSDVIKNKYISIVNAEIPSLTLKEIYSLALDEVSRNVKKPGFRKGFVPKEIIESEYAENIKEVFLELLNQFANRIASVQSSSSGVVKAEYSIIPPSSIPPESSAYVRIQMWIDEYLPVDELKGKKLQIPALKIPSDDELKEMALVQLASFYSEPVDEPADESKVLNIHISVKDGEDIGGFTIQSVELAEKYSNQENTKAVKNIHSNLKGKVKGDKIELKAKEIKPIVGSAVKDSGTLIIELEQVKKIDIESVFKDSEKSFEDVMDETAKSLKRKFEEDNETAINHILLDLAGIELNITPVLKTDFWHIFLSLVEITYSRRIPYFVFADNIKDLETSFGHHSLELLYKFIREERVLETAKHILSSQGQEVHQPTEADI